MHKVVLASNNKGKIAEFKHIFADLQIQIVAQSELDIPEIDEPYLTFIENALHKARHCAKYSNLPSLADDSGLCVKSLSGKPGVYSARYAGIPKSDFNNNRQLINDLTPYKNKSAYFYCMLVLVRHEFDPQPLIADGFIHGQIIDQANGNNGFGYDPHFYLPQLGKTIAQLNDNEKNQISHRRLAINNLLTKFKEIEDATCK